MSKQTNHIIFDLDGTIIDSKEEILKTYKIVFNTIIPSVPPDVEGLNYGLTLNGVLSGVYGSEADKIEAAKQLFASIYDNSDYAETHLYESVVETLRLLKQEGNELYIATNKRLSPTLKILDAKNIRHLFSFVAANEMQPGITLTKQQMVGQLKKQGGFTSGFMVGDSASDIQAGINEDLKTIAVTYGYEHKDVLTALNPTYSIDHFQQITQLI